MKASKYEILLTVFEEKNITKAAERLYYTQSGVSQIISNFEKELGLSLMIRSKNGIQLTECGRRIRGPLEQIVKWERTLYNTAHSMNGIEEGTLRIGAFTSVSMQWLPYIIKEFSGLYPKIEYQLVYGGYDDIEAMINSGKIDCGFTVEQYNTEIAFLPLMCDEFKVVLPKTHPLTAHDVITPDVLNNESFIFPSVSPEFGVSQIFKNAHITPNIRFESDDDYTAIAMTELGLGITIMPQLILDGANAEIEIRPLAGHPSRSIGIAVHSLQYATPLTRRFLDFVSDWIAKNYPEQI